MISGRNPRQGKKRNTSEGEVREGKIIRLELSRKKKEVGDWRDDPVFKEHLLFLWRTQV